MIAIDTNVLVYSVDAGDPVKQAKARALLRQVLTSGEAMMLPWQVAVEFLAKLRKWKAADQLTGDDVRARFDEFLATWVVAIPTVRMFQLAMEFYDRCSLSHWDSLLVAACREAGVTLRYSEDMQHGADYGGVKIVNPFA
jgi:predicted nucleic acid-binding protein